MNAREAMLALLAARAPDRSVCPSEVAKSLAEQSEPGRVPWRDEMPQVHAVVDQLLAEGLIRLTWKGTTLAKRAGPYRIRRP